MAILKRDGNKSSKVAVPLKLRSAQDGYITTLHPEGSANNIKIVVRERQLIRPEIYYWKAVLNVLIPVVFCFIAFQWTNQLAIIMLCVYTLLRLGGIIIWFIHLYQRYASDEIRLACVFEPSCSEYMILSIQKYGAICGCINGIKRLKRCHYPNGGNDYP
jgi:putative component of membrane protein insertase Oxa1/YidC/SpoIIIJ protein YidD